MTPRMIQPVVDIKAPWIGRGRRAAVPSIARATWIGTPVWALSYRALAVPIAATCTTEGLDCLAQLDRVFQINRHKLRNAALGHGDTEQAAHARHCDRVVRNDDKAGVGRTHHFVEQVAEPVD